MKIFLSVVLGAFLLGTLALFGVDFVFFLKNRYCRFHIGRWPDEKTWQEAVKKVALKWSRKTPTVRITDNSRYLLLDMLSGKYRSQSIQSWQNAAILLGLLETGDRESARASAARFVGQDGTWRKPPVAVDAAMLSYAILKTADSPEQVRPAMDFMAELIRKNTDAQGLVAYTGGPQNQDRYVDTVGLVCPFLALYARVYGKPEFEQMAFDQLRFYHDCGLLPGTQLPNHAVRADTRLPLGVFGWGRGTAWYLLGLTDTYYELQSEPLRRQVKAWIGDAAEDYRKFQAADGGFGSILQQPCGYDSSATAALGWFYAQCAVIFGRETDLEVTGRCLQKLRKVTRITGAIDWCQGDTKGIGIFAQTYDIMPFAQGMALRAMGTHNMRDSNVA